MARSSARAMRLQDNYEVRLYLLKDVEAFLQLQLYTQ